MTTPPASPSSGPPESDAGAGRSGDALPPGSRAFPRALRVRGTRDFDRVMKTGVRVTDRAITLWAAANGLPHARFGLVVARRHGPAVARNRLKRILREAFRLSREALPPGIDLVVAPRVGALRTMHEAREALRRAAQRAAALLRSG